MVNSIPKGYKRTEIGIIPEDWEVKRLGEIGQFKKGKGISKEDIKNRGLGSIRYGELYTHYNEIITYVISRIDYYTAQKSTKLSKGDILFTGSGETKEEIGKSSTLWVNEEVYAGGDIIILTPNKEISSPIFLGYLLNSNSIQKQKSMQAQGDAVVHIYIDNLKNLQILLPPISEQHTIARVLSDFDELIESLDKLIEKKKAIKKGAMQELLTGKKRLQGFSGKWVRKKLGEIGEIITGGTPPTKIKKYWNGYIPWITPTDISGKKNIFDSERKITREAQKMVGELPKNTLLVTCIASIGKNAILRKNGACNQQINAIIPNSNFNIDFLYYLLEFNSNRLFKIAGATATPIISKYEFSLFEISLPPTLEEQRAIAQILSDMDEEIEALEKKKEKYKMLKKGAMELLLTGKVRLKDYKTNGVTK